ncbi:hypothetical protein [Streptomyces sp. XH2]|uniref:hypothetical protein n=1 Tax=Streptomyces sp. XH2 TaxID=3412483 RepID=UPI003C7CDE6D
MSGQQQVEHAEPGAAPEGTSPGRPDLSNWCLRCSTLRVRFYGAARLGRVQDAVELEAEFERHRQGVHS